MRIRFIAHMPARGYSGGRLLALTYAEALGCIGENVDMLVDEYPEMYEEFKPTSKIRLVRADLKNLARHVDRNLDIVVIVPGLGAVIEHGEATRYAIECGARIVLVNFETPNWFNKYSPVKRDPELWAGWNIVSQHADLILSLTNEGDRYAKEYYVDIHSRCTFQYCHAAINSPVADSILPESTRKNRIVVLTRLDAHKGFDNLEALVCEELAGFSVEIYFGTGQVPADVKRQWVQRFTKAGLCLAFPGPIGSAQRKFELLKSSKMLFFPTRFEGFGLPPLEAAYCLLPVACSDLPVLREFGQDAFCYGDPMHVSKMRAAVWRALKHRPVIEAEHDRISQIARLESCGRRLAQILKTLL